MECKKRLFFTIVLIFALILFFMSLISGACSEEQVNINNASAEDLDLIIWVGPATAQAIIDTRPFSCVDDLINVSGIGETKLKDIKNQGLACVIDSDGEKENGDDENGQDENGNESFNDSDNSSEYDEECDNDEDYEGEVIKYVLNTSNQISRNLEKNFTLNKIKLNTKSTDSKDTKHAKDIKTNHNYALYGLGVFSILIITLMILKFRKHNKNEFE